MARPTLFSNRKLLKLAQRVQSKSLAVGALELIWHVANETGNPIIGDADDIETITDWRGVRGELVAALMDAGSNGGPGFIVLREDGRYEIHDYWHHAPDYVRKRAKREDFRREKGDDFDRDRSPTGQHSQKAVDNHRKQAQRQPQRVENNHDFGAGGSARDVPDRGVTGQHSLYTVNSASSDRSLTGQNGAFPDCLPGVARTPAPAPAPQREEKNPPTPLERGAGLLAQAKRRPPREVRSASNTAWGHVIEGASRTHRRSELEHSDPVLAAAVHRLGGWNRFGQSTAIGTLKAPFRELYEQLLEHEPDDVGRAAGGTS